MSKLKRTPGAFMQHVQMTANNRRAEAEFKEILFKAQKSFQCVTYWTLYNKFDWGAIKMTNFAHHCTKYWLAYDKGDPNFTPEAVAYYLKKKADIDIKAEVNKIPFRDLMYMMGLKYPKNPRDAVRQSTICRAGAESSLLILCLTLKQNYRMSKADLKKFIGWVVFYAGCYDPKFELTNQDIVETMREEIGLKLGGIA